MVAYNNDYYDEDDNDDQTPTTDLRRTFSDAVALIRFLKIDNSSETVACTPGN